MDAVHQAKLELPRQRRLPGQLHITGSQALPIVAVLPLTAARPGRRVYSTEVLLRAGTAGLPMDSIVMAHQVRTLSTRRLGDRSGELSDPDLRDTVRRALAVFLDLD